MSADTPPVEDIFDEAIKFAPGDVRNAFLDEACGPDQSLRQRVERLLRAADEAGPFLESPAIEASPTVDLPVTEKPGDTIGPYKLLQQIGEGGMGVVYMAEQTQPIVRRVAVKIIKPGMDTRQVIARFEAERQALALMDHPNIAKVLDAGQTATGRPFFVMELVNGLPVTQFCDDQHLTPKQRLELFIPVCQAVQHAHQKGIIHRDLKPSNILVALYDGQPVPKVIDFGVAKATTQTLTQKTMFTQFGQVIGTLEYMSPEQAERNQLDVDTRSDIYSLGVVLYELLTGETPFDPQRLRSVAFEELLRIIREDEPSRPSMKVSTSPSLPSIAAKRRMEPARLGRLIHGELDWIVMRCLEKDRSRRYETADGLAADLERHLADEPVTASPPSAMYRCQKFVRRNRVPVIGAAVVTSLLVVGLVSMSLLFRWAMHEKQSATAALATAKEARQAESEARNAERIQRDLAIQRAAEAEANSDLAEEAARNAESISSFLVDLLSSVQMEHQHQFLVDPDLLSATSPPRNPYEVGSEPAEGPLILGRDARVADLLDQAAETIPVKFAAEPEVRQRLHQVLMESYAALGLTDARNEQQLAVLQLSEELYGSDSRETNGARVLAGLCLAGTRGIQLTRQAYEIAQSRDPQDVQERLQMAHLYAKQLIDYEGVDPNANCEMAIAICQKELEHWDIQPSPVGSLDEPFESDGRSLAAAIALAQGWMGRYDDNFRTSVDYLGFGERDHRRVWRARSLPRWFSYSAIATGRLDDAERLLRICLKASEETVQDDADFLVRQALKHLAIFLRQRDKLEEAITLNQRVIRALADSRYIDQQAASTKRQVAEAKRELALAYAQHGDQQRADQAFREALSIVTAALGFESDTSCRIWRDWMITQGFGTPNDWTDHSLRELLMNEFVYQVDILQPDSIDGNEFDFSAMELTIEPYDKSEGRQAQSYRGPAACRLVAFPEPNGLYRIDLSIPARRPDWPDFHSSNWILASDWKLRFYPPTSNPFSYVDEWQDAFLKEPVEANRRILSFRRMPFEIPEIKGWLDFILIAETSVTLPVGDYRLQIEVQNESGFTIDGRPIASGEVIHSSGSPVEFRFQLPDEGRYYFFELNVVPMDVDLSTQPYAVAEARRDAARSRQDWGEAADALREMIQIAENSDGQITGLELTHRINELAWVLGEQLDDQPGALQALQRAEDIRAKLFPDPNHPERLWQQDLIAQQLAKMGDGHALRRDYERARSSGRLWNPSNTQITLHYAAFLRDHQQTAAAVRVEREVIDALRKAAQENQPEINDRTHQVAEYFQTRKIMPTGIEMCELAARVAAESVGEQSLEYTHRLNALGTLWADTGEGEQALEVFEKARSIRVSLLSEQHEQVAWEDRLIAMTLESMGKIDESLMLRRKVWESFQRATGRDSINTQQVFDELTEAYERAGDPETATRLLADETARLVSLGTTIGPQQTKRLAALKTRLKAFTNSDDQ